MKQMITKIFSRVALVAVIGVLSAATTFGQGTTSTLTFSAACAGSGTADDGASWTVTSDGTESTYDSTKGIHYGTNSAQVTYIQLSTSDISGTITKIVVNASTASGVTASVSATVGGAAFGGDAQSLSTSATNYTFNGSASGEIVVRVAKPSKATKAIYVKSVAVTYTAGGTTTYTVTYDANGGTGTMTDSNSPYNSGATVTVLSNTFTREGYSFSNWNTAANGSGQDYSAGGTFTISANTTLYAQWTNNAAATTTAIDDSGITNTDVYLGTEAGSLSASVTSGGNPVDGASVTWSGNNDAVATIDASTGVVTLVAAGTVTFTASYAGVANEYQASSNTYEMTVTSSEPYVQPTSISITPNYAFWGKDAQFSGNTYDELSGSKDNVYLSWTRGGGSTYANTTGMRFYKDNNLTFTPPTGYEIKSIVLSNGTYTDLSFTPTGFDDENDTWTGSATSVTMSRPSDASSYYGITSFTITIGLPSSVAKPTFSVAEGTYKNTQTVTLATETDGATIYYTTNGTTPTTSSTEYAAAISVNETMTIKAIASKDEEVSDVSTATYTILGVHAGTKADPYTVADAIVVIDAEAFTSNVYVTGIVSQGGSVSSGAITYYISADGTTSGTQLQVYKGKGLDNTNFESDDDIQVGDQVVIYGSLTKYYSTYEFSAGNYLTSFNRPAEPTITPASYSINAPYTETYGTLNVTYKDVEEDTDLLEIKWYEADGETYATYDWVDAEINASFNIDYVITANAGSQRTAYFKIYGVDADANDVYSNLITITQAEYTVPTGDNYSLFTGNLVEGDYIIYYDEKAMNTTVNNSRLQYAEVTPSADVINTANTAIIWHIAPSGDYWTVYNAASGKYAASTGTANKAQMLADGTDDQALWTVTVEEGKYEFVNKANDEASVNKNLRNNGAYGFACYGIGTGGALSLYKLDTPAVAESINATLHNGLYWATFYSGVARYKLLEGTKAYTMNSSNQLYLLGTDGSVIPAGTAVVIISDTATPSITQIPNTGDVTVYGGGNILKGSHAAVAVSGISGTPYVMGIVGGNLGFYKFTGETIPANKAYYIVNE